MPESGNESDQGSHFEATQTETEFVKEIEDKIGNLPKEDFTSEVCKQFEIGNLKEQRGALRDCCETHITGTPKDKLINRQSKQKYAEDICTVSVYRG